MVLELLNQGSALVRLLGKITGSKPSSWTTRCHVVFHLMVVAMDDEDFTARFSCGCLLLLVAVFFFEREERDSSHPSSRSISLQACHGAVE